MPEAREELSREQLEYLIVRRPIEVTMERHKKGEKIINFQLTVEEIRLNLFAFFVSIADHLSGKERKRIADVFNSRPVYTALDQKIDELMKKHPGKVTDEERKARQFVKQKREAVKYEQTTN